MIRPLTPPINVLLATLLLSGPLLAQGVPTFDAASFARTGAIIAQRDRDLGLQRHRASQDAALQAVQEGQSAALSELQGALTTGTTAPAIDLSGLEGSADGAEASALYQSADTNPAAERLFGDARDTVETLIIRAARATSAAAGVSRAGLTLVQWRCLLQALIWQESRFQIGAKSSVGAFGLTQIMPDTARDLGIFPGYYDDPYLQVIGGARYLSQMLGMFDGNIIHALAAYNAGPGRVQQYHGVPPFAETQAYVQVIPAQYNRYLAAIGGADALGTIDPVLLTASSASLSADAAGHYGDYAQVSVAGAAARVRDIIARIETTASVQEALALNTYARAELVRILAIRSRIKASQMLPVSAQTMALAAAQATERQFMDFTQERSP